MPLLLLFLCPSPGCPSSIALLPTPIPSTQSSLPRHYCLGPGWADRNGPHRPAAGHHQGLGCAGARGGVDLRCPGHECHGRATGWRGCRPGFCYQHEPRRTRRGRAWAMAASLEAETPSGVPRATGRGDWCVAQAAAASAASCIPGRPPGGTRWWSTGV